MALKITFFMFLVAALVTDFTVASRQDYIYIDSTSSYYKFHKTEATWFDARDTCQSEGSFLFHPKNEVELRLVLSVLGVGDNGGMFLYVGISDTAEHGNYQTVDGQPISEVHKKWGSGEPSETSNYHCGRINVKTYDLFNAVCDDPRRYICKHNRSMENSVSTAIEEIKTIITNSSDKQTAVLERLAEAAANQAASIDQLTVNLAASLERLTANMAAALDRQTDITKVHAANQTAILERIAQADENQAEAMQQQAGILRLQVFNQTGTLERLALALEKLVTLQEESNQIDERSGQ